MNFFFIKSYYSEKKTVKITIYDSIQMAFHTINLNIFRSQKKFQRNPINHLKKIFI